MSTLLYHAEYGGVPPAAVEKALDNDTVRLVDRCQAPGDTSRPFAGVRLGLIAGHPGRQGGFGALPLREHMLARHAVWGARLVLGLAGVGKRASAPWVRMAEAVLQEVEPGPFQPLALLVPDSARLARMPAPLRSMLVGLHAFPPAGLAAPIAPGAWCYSAPLWGNPATSSAISGHRLLEEAAGSALARYTTIRTVGDLLRAHQQVRAAVLATQRLPTSMAARQAGWEVLRDNWGACSSAVHILRGSLGDTTGALGHLMRAMQALPGFWAIWAVKVIDGREQPTTEQQAVQHILLHLGWALPAPGGGAAPFRTCASLTVSDATALQMERVQQERREDYHAPFLRHALALPAGAPVADDAHQELHRLLDSLWRLRWDNQHKEVFWRLTLNGLPTPKRMGKWGQRCVCGFVTPDRPHLMWDCPVAHAVVQVLEGQLGVAAGGLQRRQVWLMQAPQLPAGPIHPHVWRVVCLAALCAMRKGWKTAARARICMEEWQEQQQQQQQPRPALRRRSTARGAGASPPIAPSMASLQQSAVLHFWALLGDYARLDQPSAELCAAVGVAHPLLRSAQGSPPRWVLHTRGHPAPLAAAGAATAAATATATAAAAGVSNPGAL